MVTIKITNKTAHLKHIQLGGGAGMITLPVTEKDTAVKVSVDPGKEPTKAARLYRALKSAPVQHWIETDELAIEGDLDALKPAHEAEAEKARQAAEKSQRDLEAQLSDARSRADRAEAELEKLKAEGKSKGK